MAFLAHYRYELVHDPTGHARKRVLCFLAHQCLGHQITIICARAERGRLAVLGPLPPCPGAARANKYEGKGLLFP